MDDRYQLGTVSKRLRRRVNAIMTIGILLLGLVFLTGVSIVEGVRAEPGTWVVVAGAAVVGVAAIVLIFRTLSPMDRATIDAATRLTLPPLPRGEVVPVLRVALHPGFVWRRRLDGRDPAWPEGRTLVADGSGLTIPGWLFDQPPRAFDRFAMQHLAWADITRFRVQADSDGPDVYAIEVRTAGARTARWRVRRREVDDEIALLDHVRSVGGLAIELETSVPSR